MTDNVALPSHICFIVCDGGPAAHFATFAKHLSEEHSLRISIYATAQALAKLNDSQIPDGVGLFPFTLNDTNDGGQQEQAATQLIGDCVKRNARTIIVDVGNKFDSLFQMVLSTYKFSSKPIRSWCYYDNPETYVPGGYSIKAGETINASNLVLFANMNLAHSTASVYSSPETTIHLADKTVRGIGYYPVADAEKLLRQRHTERDSVRAQMGWFGVKHLFVYFGGNNDVYFDQAFPAFLSHLSQVDSGILSDVVFLLHQHPAAKKQNRDVSILEDWLTRNKHIQLSTSSLKNSDQAQIVADAALYHQTSMAPQFALLGLPTMQVGHEVYRDVLVQYNLCHTATNATELSIGLTAMKARNDSSAEMQKQKQMIYGAIGYTPEWSTHLYRSIVEEQ